MFGGYTEIKCADIESAKLGVGIKKYLDRFLPPVRLNISYNVDGARKELAINLKVFDAKANSLILSHISQRCR